MLQPEVRELNVRVLSSAEVHAWDALVADSAQGTVFHTSDWLIRNAALLGQDAILLGCYEDDELIGGCPLYLSNPYKIIRLASSATTLAPYGGIIVSGLTGLKQRRKDLHIRKVAVAILEHIARKKFDHVNLINAPGFRDIRAFIQRGWSPRVYYTYVLPLNGNLLETASKDVRQNIRKAQRLDIRPMRKFDPDILWDLTLLTFARQHLEPPVSRSHLTGLLDMIQEKGIGEMWIANTPSGETAATEVIVWDTKMAHSWSAASSPRHLPTRAPSLLSYEAFNSLKERNHKYLNLMTGNTPHLGAFVAGFNPGLVPYYGVELPRPKYHIATRLKSNLRPGSSRNSALTSPP